MVTPAQIVRYFDKFLTALETSLTDITNNVAAIQAAQAAANAAQTSANTAQSTANTANTTATRAKKNDALSTSWTSPGTILTASDAGTSATITVSTHTRKYSDATSASVTGSSITGLAYSTTYYVYYDDDAHAGGAQTYSAVTNPNTAAYNAATGRHYCGSVTTPAAGGGSTTGGVTPTGGGYSGPGAIP